MLLRIQIFPADGGGGSQSQHPASSSSSKNGGGSDGFTMTPSATHYASLGCPTNGTNRETGGTNDEPGRIWSLGRKVGDYLVTNDKSVSREHVVLTVVSNRRSCSTTSNIPVVGPDVDTKDIDDAAAEETDRHVAAITAPCTTPDQVQACHASDDHQYVVLRNIGKLGSYLVWNQAIQCPPTSPDNNDDDSDDSSATADETDPVRLPKSSSQAVLRMSESEAVVLDVACSEVSKQWCAAFAAASQNPLHNNKEASNTSSKETLAVAPRLKLIAADESIVLEALSVYPKTHSSDNNKPVAHPSLHHHQQQSKTVIVQCGKLGTTIVIQRVLLRFVVATDAKPAMAKLEPLLQSVLGCQIHDTLWEESEKNDHQLHDNSSSNGMYLVTETYAATHKQLAAWSAGIPLVTPAFVAALLNRASPGEPWPNAQQYTPQDSHTRSRFWLQPANPKLWSSLTFLSLQSDDNEALIRAAGAKIVRLYDYVDVSAADQDVEPDVSSVRQVLSQERALSSLCFAMESKTRTTKLLKQIGIPLFSDKQLARGISQQLLLSDEQGSPIPPLVESTEIDDVSQRQSVVTKNNSERMAEMSNDAKNSPKASSVQSNDGACSMAMEDDSFDPSQNSDNGNRRRSLSPILPHNSSLQEVEPGTRPKRSCRSPIRASDEKSASASHSMPDGMLAHSINSNHSILLDTTEKTIDDEIAPIDLGEDLVRGNVVSEMGTLHKRKLDHMAMNQDGWMMALPQGKERLAYRRTDNEIGEKTGQVEFHHAVTVKLVGWNANDCSLEQAASRPTIIGGPSFKAFRKNCVPAPSSIIPLKHTTTKESEHHRDLEKQREENETQQRHVDSLFREVPVSSARGSRTRVDR